ncbi:hypothetical protein FGG08_001258 [Glutinoglossum americanum]|uniref:DUF8035 domain-containing protein n=1 Tax=Glutinoglossum americanum TaxID=1670608 RepID=A0A9P8I785_9PEZI|nr:hypothetical protein FGG08_001258 [Glutinoglossum americanum]
MSRRYAPSEGFVEERERDIYRDGSIDEVDTIYRTRSGPEFLREDYGRSSAGPLIVTTRERDPIIEEPSVHREIVTHHRHIDHGVERAPPRRSFEEIEIRRRHGGREVYDDDIIFERESGRRRRREERLRRRRSVGGGRGLSRSELDLTSEADFYNRRAQDRRYLGEGLNGVTRDWTIVDVPPGTQRVRMDGVGGASQEVTWQRYNGVRRSKFIAPGETYEDRSGRRYYGGRSGSGDVWTEITKDLVVREALEELGYEYEETEFFFYVIEYLRYEHVLELVELSEDMRRERHERIREIEWERERRRPFESDERIIERDREVIYARPRRYY